MAAAALLSCFTHAAVPRKTRTAAANGPRSVRQTLGQPKRRSARPAGAADNDGDLHQKVGIIHGRCSCELCALTGLPDYSKRDSFLPTLRRSAMRIHKENEGMLDGCNESGDYADFMELVCEDIQANDPQSYAKFCKHIVVYSVRKVKMYFRTTRKITYTTLVRVSPATYPRGGQALPPYPFPGS